MTDVELAHAYIAALAARDYDAIDELIADTFRLRDLSPHGFTQVDERADALGGLRGWLDGFTSVDVLDADAYEIGGRTYLRAKVRFVHPEAGERVLEQHHLLTIEDGRVSEIDELCTGLFVP